MILQGRLRLLALSLKRPDKYVGPQHEDRALVSLQTRLD